MLARNTCTPLDKAVPPVLSASQTLFFSLQVLVEFISADGWAALRDSFSGRSQDESRKFYFTDFHSQFVYSLNSDGHVILYMFAIKLSITILFTSLFYLTLI